MFDRTLNLWAVFVRKLIYSLSVLGLFLVGMCLWQCQAPNAKVKRSLYLWKTQIHINSADTTFFQKHDIARLYVRYFDISWHEKHGPVPIGKLRYSGVLNQHLEVIPVIFIKNEVMRKLTDGASDTLVLKMASLIKEMSRAYFPGRPIGEIQLDCDWSEGTKDRYFKWIRSLKANEPTWLWSATIRLHQLKYRDKTGVPPVDKGTLMYYNMGNYKSYEEPNSILNNELGVQYLAGQSSYPLPLSLALPKFSWSVWFKQETCQGFFYSIHQQNADTLNFLKPSQDDFYEVTQDTVWQDQYLRYGDQLRVESASTEALQKARRICNPIIDSDTVELILFSYPFNHNLPSSHETDLEKIYSWP